MNTETQRHRVFILWAAIHLCVSVSLCSNLYPLDLWSLARARSYFLIITKLFSGTIPILNITFSIQIEQYSAQK